MLDEETVNGVKEMLEATVSPDDLELMSAMVQRIALMIAFQTCGTINKELLCAQVFEDKGGDIPLEMIEKVYDQNINDMLGAEFQVVDGDLGIDPGILPVVLRYREMLQDLGEEDTSN